jgi:hypothetical protein
MAPNEARFGLGCARPVAHHLPVAAEENEAASHAIEKKAQPPTLLKDRRLDITPEGRETYAGDRQ